MTYCGNTYAPRVMKHNLFAVQTSSDQGVDAIPRVSLSMANADSYFSELEREVGWKGATLTVTFLFYNLLTGAADIGRGGACFRASSTRRTRAPSRYSSSPPSTG